MAMKNDINIALSRARLRCENGLQFVSPVLLPNYLPVPFRRIFHNTNSHTRGKKNKLFMRQIIKPHLHGAAYVMCFLFWFFFFTLRVVIPDRGILEHLHSLGHSDVKIRGETLINHA